MLGRLLAGTLVATALVGVPAAHAVSYECRGHPATIVGTPSADRLVGTPGPDVVVARGGDDVVIGAAGDDLVCGGDGADTLRGGPGADELHGQRDGRGFDRGGSYRIPDVLSGGPGADLLDIGGDARRADQGGSHGIVTYASAPRGVSVDLAAGTASGDGADRILVQRGLEVHGTAYDDVLLGGAGRDQLSGLAGDDRLEGLAGADVLSPDEPHAARDHDAVDGGPGADWIVAWRGSDLLHGGDGADLVGSYSAQPSAAYGDAGDDDVFTSVTKGPGYVLEGGEGVDSGSLGRPGANPTWGNRPPGPTTTLRVEDGTLSRSGAQTGTVAGIETWTLGDDLRWIFYGTDGPDIVTGSYYQPFRAWTYGGDDEIDGSGRRDHIDAGDGHDVVGGQEGRDTCLNAEVVQSCEITG